jgi:hypothetical protein
MYGETELVACFPGIELVGLSKTTKNITEGN